MGTKDWLEAAGRKLRRIGQAAKVALVDWINDAATRFAAALAFYTIFSLAPLLVIAVVVAGAVFGIEAARTAMLDEVRAMVGGAGAQLARQALEQAQASGRSITAAIVGVAALLFGATAVFAQLQDALNAVWEIKPEPKGLGVRLYLRKRVLSFGMVLAIGFLLLVSLAVSAVLNAVTGRVATSVPHMDLLWRLLSFLVSFSIITVLFGAIYKVLPDARVAWRDVWIGSITTALLFTLGKFLIGLYLGRSALGDVYGAAGSLAIILVWVYYSGMIFLYGAEFTQAYLRLSGRRIVPEEHAVKVSDQKEQRTEETLGHEPTARQP